MTTGAFGILLGVAACVAFARLWASESGWAWSWRDPAMLTPAVVVLLLLTISVIGRA